LLSCLAAIRAKFDKLRIPALEAFLNVAEADDRRIEPFAKALVQTQQQQTNRKEQNTASGLKSAPNLAEWI
jgi:hypothetical protein